MVWVGMSIDRTAFLLSLLLLGRDRSCRKQRCRLPRGCWHPPYFSKSDSRAFAATRAFSKVAGTDTVAPP